MLIEKTVGYLTIPLLLFFIQLRSAFCVAITLLDTKKIAVSKTERISTVILLGWSQQLKYTNESLDGN